VLHDEDVIFKCNLDRKLSTVVNFFIGVRFNGVRCQEFANEKV
jgi:hypothetical protein